MISSQCDSFPQRALAPEAARFGASRVLVVGLALVGVAQLRYDRSWEAPSPAVTASKAPEVIARGEYLVWGPGHCAGCHGAIEELDDYEKTGKRIPLTGGFVMPVPLGAFTVPNITSDPETGIGEVSDGQLARALRHGVARDGTMLFPIMPFTDLSEEDMIAVISYLRTLEPVASARPKRNLSLLGKLLFAYVMEPVGPSQPVRARVDAGPSVEYGEYLAKSVANCYGCHTNRDLKTGAFIGEPMAGGLELPHRDAVYVVPNITPAGKGSRIAGMSEAEFVNRMRSATPSAQGSPMPWIPASQFEEEDLRAIWMYLQSVESVDRDTGAALKQAP